MKTANVTRTKPKLLASERKRRKQRRQQFGRAQNRGTYGPTGKPARVKTINAADLSLTERSRYWL